MSFPRFYPIFDSADWIARALPLGVKLVQIRIKDVDADQLVRELTRARDLCRAHGATLVVNDHWQTAMDLDTIADLQKLSGILAARGYSADDIEGICWRNFVALLRRVWK